MPRIPSPHFQDILQQRLSRRHFLKLTVAGAFTALTPGGFPFLPSRPAHAEESVKTSFTAGFTPPDAAIRPEFRVAAEYRSQILLRWGDPLHPDLPPFNPARLTADEQQKRFGYNNDYIAFFALPTPAGADEAGLLCVNHETTDPTLMIPENEKSRSDPQKLRALVNLELAAHGLSIVEFRRYGESWQAYSGRYTRRLDALSTLCRISGPAAGHSRMQTTQDPSGTVVKGTLGNCAGGVTPWGTWLTAEENIDQYFSGDLAFIPEEKRNHARMGIRTVPAFSHWAEADARFNLHSEPHEPNRFGWVVEVDPFNPGAPPVKRTALGRFKHEGATVTLAPDGRVVVYMADDEAAEYLYRFTSRDAFVKGGDTSTLLDHGTLEVARFYEDSSMQWLPLVHGFGPLIEENGFASQADVVIEARTAAEMMGATPLDRPEDIAVIPETQQVVIALTGNPRRLYPDPLHPFAPNLSGQVLVLTPPKGDHMADSFTWDIILPPKSLTRPDNLAVDPEGRLWVATDGMERFSGLSDGLFLWPLTDGAKPLRLVSAPLGAEISGPCFTPDGSTLFLSVQHPGEGSDFHTPSTRWPDFQEGMPPRPAIVAIRKRQPTDHPKAPPHLVGSPPPASPE